MYLASIVQPSRALMPVLIAKCNISFYDAIGRPPRVLDYSCFVSYKVGGLDVPHMSFKGANISRYFKLSSRIHSLAVQGRVGSREDYIDSQTPGMGLR